MRALLLDALGTLVRLEPPAPLLARALGIPQEDAARAIAAEIDYYRAHLDEARDGATLADLRRRCAAVVAEVLSREDDLTDALLSSLRFTPFDDVLPSLARVRSRGIPVVVVSNWDVSLHDVLARVGIDPLLDGVLTSAEVGSRKPDPAIFHRALELADVAPQHAIHVGDSLNEDVAGALAAGIEPILIRRGDAPVPGAVRTISSLSELPDGP